jgi:hypothetical protein
MRQASSTISRISRAPSMASRTWTQLYRMSDALGIENLAGSEATSPSRSSFGNAKPMMVSSREKER